MKILLTVMYISLFWVQTLAAKPVALPLANTFDPNKHELADYLFSEKLDGVRAYWDGKQLRSRNGLQFAAPAWFIKALPPESLDGELWGGRNTFEKVSGLVRRETPHAGWSKVRFMVFELPNGKGVFTERYLALRQLEQNFGNRYWAVVEQRDTPASLAVLWGQLQALSTEGGEGFMLKRKQSLYRGGRSDDLLKVKRWEDADARVLELHPGKGRLSGVLGSITVMMPSGIKFKIGSGFSDKQRRKPPAIGAVISYKHSGFTKYGKPKFPVFWRIRHDN